MGPNKIVGACECFLPFEGRELRFLLMGNNCPHGGSGKEVLGEQSLSVMVPDPSLTPGNDEPVHTSPRASASQTVTLGREWEPPVMGCGSGAEVFQECIPARVTSFVRNSLGPASERGRSCGSHATAHMVWCCVSKGAASAQCKLHDQVMLSEEFQGREKKNGEARLILWYDVVCDLIFPPSSHGDCDKIYITHQYFCP